ncbi:MAG: hypothetical protein IPN92_17515 [Chromatiaceae bacterium]|nr:hypothetical protein [Chromatiaceae bacterium]
MNHLLLLLLFVFALGLSACATPADVKDTQAPSSGPTFYGKFTGSVERIWRP